MLYSPVTKLSYIHVQYCSHGTRIYTEEEAKVVAAVQGTEFIKFLAALQIQRQDDLKKRIDRKVDICRIGALEKWMIFKFTPHQTITLPKWMFFKSSLLLHGIRPLNSRDDLCLLCCINPSSMTEVLEKIQIFLKTQLMYIYIYYLAPVVQYCTVYTVRKEMKCSRETEIVHDTVLWGDDRNTVQQNFL